uniref:TIGR04452 family lipoprotein n=1 Tax=Parastrongyloides trichosuri TaxID=131310 RepID=A0A0N4ZYG0_PARTI
MNFLTIVIVLFSVIYSSAADNGIKVGMVTKLKFGDKNVTRPFLDKFEKDMKTVIMNANLHEDDFGEVNRDVLNKNGSFSMRYVTEKGIEKCTQAIALAQKAVNDVEEIVEGEITCGDMPKVVFNKI